MSNLQALRDLVLSYNPEMCYTLILDRDLLDEADTARDRLRSAINKLDKGGDSTTTDRRRLSDKASPKLEELEADLLAVYEKAAKSDKSVVAVFRRLPADGDGSYQELAEGCSKNGLIQYGQLYDKLIEASYLRCESPSSEDLGLTLDQVRPILSNGDLEALGDKLVKHNRAPQTVPFDPRPSGKPATS